jgi:hypothetical protein
MERKVTRRWQLQDLLHGAGEDGLTQSDYGDPTGDVTQARTDPIDPKLVGNTTTLDMNEKTGLPETLTDDERKYLLRAIRKATVGANRTLEWVGDIQCATQLKTTLEDRQLHNEDDRRYITVTLRAQPYFQGRPAQDNVRLIIEEDNAGDKIYFAKYVMMYINVSCNVHYNVHFRLHFPSTRCLAFMMDEGNNAFVAVRWYKEKETFPVNTVLELPALQLAGAKTTASYSVMPVHCIVNGALLIKCAGTFWAVQSPREEVEYIRANQQ